MRKLVDPARHQVPGHGLRALDIHCDFALGVGGEFAVCVAAGELWGGDGGGAGGLGGGLLVLVLLRVGGGGLLLDAPEGGGGGFGFRGWVGWVGLVGLVAVDRGEGEGGGARGLCVVGGVVAVLADRGARLGGAVAGRVLFLFDGEDLAVVDYLEALLLPLLEAAAAHA